MVSKGSVLIVDDEIISREALRIILKPIRDVHTVENGPEALNQTEEADRAEKYKYIKILKLFSGN